MYGAKILVVYHCFCEWSITGEVHYSTLKLCYITAKIKNAVKQNSYNLDTVQVI